MFAWRTCARPRLTQLLVLHQQEGCEFGTPTLEVVTSTRTRGRIHRFKRRGVGRRAIWLTTRPPRQPLLPFKAPA